MAIKSIDNPERARLMGEEVNFYAEAVKASTQFRDDYKTRRKIVKSQDMPFENSPDGLLKHMVHDDLNTTECCLDIYMQFLEPGGQSGKSRRLAEHIIYVAEGEGYDLHWDVDFEVDDVFHWGWADEPKKYEWKRGDFVFVPAYTLKQHVNSSPDNEARLIVMTNRIFKSMGLDWIEQIENAGTYKGDLPTELAGPGWEPDSRIKG